MREVYIVGIGQTPVGEHWDRPLRELGADAAPPKIEFAPLFQLFHIIKQLCARYFACDFRGQFAFGAVLVKIFLKHSIHAARQTRKNATRLFDVFIGIQPQAPRAFHE